MLSNPAVYMSWHMIHRSFLGLKGFSCLSKKFFLVRVVLLLHIVWIAITGGNNHGRGWWGGPGSRDHQGALRGGDEVRKKVAFPILTIALLMSAIDTILQVCVRQRHQEVRDVLADPSTEPWIRQQLQVCLKIFHTLPILDFLTLVVLCHQQPSSWIQSSHSWYFLDSLMVPLEEMPLQAEVDRWSLNYIWLLFSTWQFKYSRATSTMTTRMTFTARQSTFRTCAPQFIFMYYTSASSALYVM